MNKEVQIQITKDEEGREIAIIPLATSTRPIRMWLSDFKELLAIGLKPPFHYIQGNIYKRFPKTRIAISRLILDADKHTQVRYLDGDCGNLVRDNLVREPGAGLYGARDRLKELLSLRRRRRI